MVRGGGGGCLAGFVMKDVARSTSGFTGSCSPRWIGPSGPNPSRDFGGGRKRGVEISLNSASIGSSTGKQNCGTGERGAVTVPFIVLWRGRNEAGPISLGDAAPPRSFPHRGSFLDIGGECQHWRFGQSPKTFRPKASHCAAAAFGLDPGIGCQDISDAQNPAFL
jgi:hypothetical protein